MIGDDDRRCEYYGGTLFYSFHRLIVGDLSRDLIIRLVQHCLDYDGCLVGSTIFKPSQYSIIHISKPKVAALQGIIRGLPAFMEMWKQIH